MSGVCMIASLADCNTGLFVSELDYPRRDKLYLPFVILNNYHKPTFVHRLLPY